MLLLHFFVDSKSMDREDLNDGLPEIFFYGILKAKKLCIITLVTERPRQSTSEAWNGIVRR